MSLQRPLKRGDLRDALVSYAKIQTSKGSIDAMSLRAAARDLGVSSGAVYRHFCDKDALLKTIVEEGFMTLRDRFHAVRPEGSRATTPEQAITRAFEFSRGFASFAEDNPTLWRMMFGRIGVMIREEHMKNPELMRYTIRDAVEQNCIDLYELGGMPDRPTLDDVRFFWSAIHGAADLSQSGARMDGNRLLDVADQTTLRCLRALGCERDLIARGQPDPYVYDAPVAAGTES